MPGNPLVRFDEGRVGRTARCRLLSYSTVSAVNSFSALVSAAPRRDSSQRSPLPRRTIHSLRADLSVSAAPRRDLDFAP